MKKIFILCLIIAVGLGVAGLGCCAKQQTDGTTKQEFSVDCIQDVICNADPNTVSAVDVFLSFVKPLIADAVPGSALLLAYATATNIKTYGCAGVKDLQALIEFIQGINFAQAKASQVKGYKMVAGPIAVDPIIAWMGRDGK